MIYQIEKVDVFGVVCLAVAVRSIVSLQSYSGSLRPPIYGDYEAQRHWQEITTNIKSVDWYRNTTDNDLLYWGLDYPPLTAYHSYTLGTIAKIKNESFVELQKSRGIESESHKSFMRLSVLIADIFVYIPAVIMLALSLKSTFGSNSLLAYLLVFLLYPGQILIDNGHFQYNNMSLGLTAFAISALLKDRHNLSAFFFTLALNYKQMELYHALPFFVYLLRMCIHQRRFLLILRKLSAIGGIVVLTSLILWMPWLRSLDSVLTVVHRLFPIGRGVFEDKVANFWCALNVVYKLKQHLSDQKMAIICLATTTAAIIPINGNLFTSCQKDKFVYCLFNTAMSFYMFSFQVHEKSILLVVLPALCLLIFNPRETIQFLEASTFSMLPLFAKDGLILPYFAMFLIYHICVKYFYLYNENFNFKFSKYYSVITFIIILISLASVFAPPPNQYPFLWPLIISLSSCGIFLLYFFFCMLKQLKRL